MVLDYDVWLFRFVRTENYRSFVTDFKNLIRKYGIK